MPARVGLGVPVAAAHTAGVPCSPCSLSYLATLPPEPLGGDIRLEERREMSKPARWAGWVLSGWGAKEGARVAPGLLGQRFRRVVFR